MKIDAVVQGQQINLTSISDILSKLNIGDVVRAQVLDITASEMMLKLFDGTTLTAATTTPIDAKRGDFVNFSVKNKIDNQLVLETVKENDAKLIDADSELKKQLTALDIKPDPKNMEIAKEIKTNSLQVNIENFDKILILMSKFKELNPSKAAFLTASNIPTEEKNIKALTQLADGKFKIGLKADELLESLSEISDQEVIKNIEIEILAIDSGKLKKQDLQQPVKPVQVNIDDGAVAEKTGIVKPQNTELDSIIKLVNSEFSKVANNVDNKSVKDLVLPKGLQDKILEFVKVNSSEHENITEKVTEFIGKEAMGFEKLPLTEQKNNNEFFNSLLSKLKGNKELLNLNNISNTNNDSPPDKIENTLKKVIDSFYVKVHSETSKDDINVKELYKNMYHKLEIIKDNIGQSSITNRDELTNKIDNLQSDIRFLNEINNHNSYVQIPLNVWDKNTTGELYVLKRDSKRKKINPESVTMFISLNTQNLGQVDSLISVNKKTVSINMRVEDKVIFDVIRDSYDDLYVRLADKGYKLVDLKYRLIDEPANILNINEVIKKDDEGNKYSIDMRI